MSRLFASLAEPNYRLYAAGSLVSNVGTWMMNTAQAWLVLELTGDGAAVATAVALQLTADPAMRGRVTALYVTVFLGSVPLVAPVIGWVGDVAGPRSAVGLSGVLSGVGVMLALGWYLYVRRAAVMPSLAPR